MKELPRIGNGVDIVSAESKAEALVINERKEEYPSRPVSLQTIVINSTEDLQKLIKGSVGIATDLPKLGLSLDVGASSTTRLDANNIYYLIVLTAGHHKKIAEPEARLNDFACRALGVDSPEIRKASALVIEKENAVHKITAEGDEIAAKLKLARNTLELKEKAVVEAQVQVDALKELFPGEKLGGKMTEWANANTKLEHAKNEKLNAQATLDETKAEKDKNDKALNKARVALELPKSDLANLTEEAGKKVEEGIKDFYSIFGTHFVKEVQFGRQLLALVTVDRRKLQRSKEYNAELKIKVDEKVNAGSSFNYKKDAITEDSLVKITIHSKGLNASIMSPPETLAELDILIKSYYDNGFKDGSEFVPSEPIDVVLESYESILRSYGIKRNTAKFMGKIDDAEYIVSRILDLRDRAVRCLVTRDLQRDAERIIEDNAIVQEDNVNDDPVVLRLEYLYEQLREIIRFLNAAVKYVKNDIFADLEAIESVLCPINEPDKKVDSAEVDNADKGSKFPEVFSANMNDIGNELESVISSLQHPNEESSDKQDDDTDTNADVAANANADSNANITTDLELGGQSKRPSKNSKREPIGEQNDSDPDADVDDKLEKNPKVSSKDSEKELIKDPSITTEIKVVPTEMKVVPKVTSKQLAELLRSILKDLMKPEKKKFPKQLPLSSTLGS